MPAVVMSMDFEEAERKGTVQQEQDDLKVSWPQPAPFITLGYGYLPLVWGTTLAHYEEPLLAEGGRILQVTIRFSNFKHFARSIAFELWCFSASGENPWAGCGGCGALSGGSRTCMPAPTFRTRCQP